MAYISDERRKVTTHRLLEMKQRGEKISMLTSYDYTMASLVDRAGVDIILVGDSASNVVAGNVTTLPITLDQMIYHGKSVVKAVQRALVVVDMPFGTYQGSDIDAVNNAIHMMKITHADALKLEGGEEILPSVKRILQTGHSYEQCWKRPISSTVKCSLNWYSMRTPQAAPCSCASWTGPILTGVKCP